jgi:hypothetical protein
MRMRPDFLTMVSFGRCRDALLSEAMLAQIPIPLQRLIPDFLVCPVVAS